MFEQLWLKEAKEHDLVVYEEWGGSHFRKDYHELVMKDKERQVA
jgi:hypothetical protein